MELYLMLTTLLLLLTTASCREGRAPREYDHGVKLPTKRPLNIAHRGSSGTHPDHTIAAYEQAIRDGADVIECDIYITKDLHLVCLHEPWLSDHTDIETRPEFNGTAKKTYDLPENGVVTELVLLWFHPRRAQTIASRAAAELQGSKVQRSVSNYHLRRACSCCQSCRKTRWHTPWDQETSFCQLFGHYEWYESRGSLPWSIGASRVHRGGRSMLHPVLRRCLPQIHEEQDTAASSDYGMDGWTLSGAVSERVYAGRMEHSVLWIWCLESSSHQLLWLGEWLQKLDQWHYWSDRSSQSTRDESSPVHVQKRRPIPGLGLRAGSFWRIRLLYGPGNRWIFHGLSSRVLDAAEPDEDKDPNVCMPPTGGAVSSTKPLESVMALAMLMWVSFLLKMWTAFGHFSCLMLQVSMLLWHWDKLNHSANIFTSAWDSMIYS